MHVSALFAINWLGPKELIVYIIIILALVAFGIYSRRAPGR